MPDEIDVRNYIDILIRRWKFVIAMPILAAIAAALVTFTIQPVYQATATIALAPATVSVSLSNLLPPYYLMVDSPRNLPPAYTPTYYLAILKSADVVAAAQTRSAITLAGDGNDRALIHITARGAAAATVAADANAYAQAGANRLQQLLVPSGAEVAAAKQKLDAAQQAFDQFLLDHKISEYDPAAPPLLSSDKRKELLALSHARDLAESIYLDFARDFAKTSILAETSYRPTVIPASVPTAPSSPQLAPNILLGGAFGLLIGILGAFTLEFSRRSIQR
jgi:uncharacterized protein involved in exopolysaccharide biosynthesis